MRSSERHICYHPDPPGWFVRIYFAGERHSRYFAWSGVYSDVPGLGKTGKRRALREAKAWRDAKYAEIDYPVSTKAKKVVLRASGETGRVGVSHARTPARESYIATWVDPTTGKSHAKHFDIGDDRARALNQAVAFRERKEIEIHGRVLVPGSSPPLWERGQ